jgi:hypothetical protein
VENYGAREATDYIVMRRMSFACSVRKATYFHPKVPANPYTRMHGPAGIQERAHTHTQTRRNVIQNFFIFHANNCFVNAPRYYVICRLHLLLDSEYGEQVSTATWQSTRRHMLSAFQYRYQNFTSHNINNKLLTVFHGIAESKPVPVAERSKVRVCGRSLAGIAVRIPPGLWISVSCVC